MKKSIFLISLICFGVLAGVAFKWLQPEKEWHGVAATALPVLVYHGFHDAAHPPQETMNTITTERFAEHMAYLHEQGYVTLGMEDVLAFLAGKKFPPKIVAIHLDDGRLSVLKALPTLLRHRLKVTHWIIPSVAEPDPAAPGADLVYMSWWKLRALDMLPGMELYSHTMTHPWEREKTLADWLEGKTPGKTAEDVRWELEESRRRMEDHLGGSRVYLNWPAGVYNDKLTALAKKLGYMAAVTVDDGLNHPGTDPFRIHRVMVNGNCEVKDLAKQLVDAKYRSCHPAP